MSSWNLKFARQWRPYFTWSSLLTYRRHVLNGETGPGTFRLNVRSPIKGAVTLRREGSDWNMFSEVLLGEVYKPVLDHLNDCQYVIDLGANIGLASLYFAEKFPCQIVAVEPHPETFELLNTNLSKLSQSGRSRTLQAAVWDTAVSLQAISAVRNPNHFSEFSVQEGKGSIVGMTVNDIIDYSGFPRVDLLKIDIEGAETQLFKSDLTWLSRVRCMAIEFHGASRAATEFDKVMGPDFKVFDYGHTVVAERF
jgi:FkbM family methyltransferase